MNFIVTPRNKLWYKAGASLLMFPPYVLCLFCCVGVPPSLPLCKFPLPLLTLKKRLYLREQDTGQGFRFMEGNSRALVKACVNRPASCPLPPEAGCPGGAPFIAIHAGVVSEILCIQLSVGGGPSYLLGGF